MSDDGDSTRADSAAESSDDESFLEELKGDLTQLIRDPTDEQKALVAAVVVIAIVDRYLWWIDTLVPFVVRTTVAVGAGFLVLFIVSYLLTGHLVPPDEEEPEAYEDEFHP